MEEELMEEEEEEEEEEITPLKVRCDVISFLIAKYGPPTLKELQRLFNCEDPTWIKDTLKELRVQGAVKPVRLNNQYRYKLVEAKDTNVMFH